MYWKTWDKHVFSGLKNAFYNKIMTLKKKLNGKNKH